MATKILEKTCDIVVVGAGHAGCEAALAGARLGLDTVMFTVSVDSIALMPCNPNVGGSSKGHLVREVDALGGAPGVRSARYAGEGRNSSDNVALLLENLSGQADRKARFRTVIALIFGGKEYQFDGVVDGTITDTPHGGGGFGYDPVFVPDGYDVTFAEMDSEAKNAISHRGRAVEKLAAFLSGAK